MYIPYIYIYIYIYIWSPYISLTFIKWMLTLETGFILFISLLLSSGCVSEVHLIAARISFGAEQSHWALKELFPSLGSNSSNETFGAQLSFNIKEDG